MADLRETYDRLMMNDVLLLEVVDIISASGGDDFDVMAVEPARRTLEVLAAADVLDGLTLAAVMAEAFFDPADFRNMPGLLPREVMAVLDALRGSPIVGDITIGQMCHNILSGEGACRNINIARGLIVNNYGVESVATDDDEISLFLTAAMLNEVNKMLLDDAEMCAGIPAGLVRHYVARVREVAKAVPELDDTLVDDPQKMHGSLVQSCDALTAWLERPDPNAPPPPSLPPVAPPDSKYAALQGLARKKFKL